MKSHKLLIKISSLRKYLKVKESRMVTDPTTKEEVLVVTEEVGDRPKIPIVSNIGFVSNLGFSLLIKR